MSIIEFKITGSAGDLYTVQYDNDVSIFTCTCPAGQKQSFCRHRIMILDGDCTSLASDNHSDILHLKKLINGTLLDQAYRDMLAAEQELLAAKSHLEKKKKALSRIMSGA